MNLDLGVLISMLNANKLSVAHLQGKLPAGVGGVVTAAAEGGGAWGLVEMEKEGLGHREGIRSATVLIQSIRRSRVTGGLLKSTKFSGVTGHRGQQRNHQVRAIFFFH